ARRTSSLCIYRTCCCCASVHLCICASVHLCACACGWKVVTPLAPIHWKLVFDGRSVSLTPSIGNHAFPCKSHCWLEKGKERWLYEMSEEDVADVRESSKRNQRQFYDQRQDKPGALAYHKPTRTITATSVHV